MYTKPPAVNDNRGSYITLSTFSDPVTDNSHTAIMFITELYMYTVRAIVRETIVALRLSVPS